MRRFVECLIPNTNCTLRCDYCYVIQEKRRTNKNAIFQYSPEIIGKALSKERLGGISLISMTGAGETLLPKELPAIVLEVLKQGHFVNLTTNGTLAKQQEELLEVTQGYHSHIHLSYSFHYLELKKRNMIDLFFENIYRAREAGCSILLQINLVDEYIPHWEDIKALSLKHVGALPQVALTRDESNNTFVPMTSLSFEKYKSIGQEMNSPLFDFTCRNFMVKRKEYCYAGWWTAQLNLATGIMRGCYGQGFSINIFEELNRAIPFRPIGKNCKCAYCTNSSHFISQGVIPSLLPLLSYGKLRNREEAGWYSEEMIDFLYPQFEDVNSFPTVLDKLKFLNNQIIEEYNSADSFIYFIKRIVYRVFHRDFVV